MNVFVLGSYVHANSLFVNQLPQAGESVAAERLCSEHGGKGLNLAVGLQRLGLAPQTLMALGNDAAGRACVDYLHSQQLSTAWLVLTPGSSGFGVGLVASDGSNVIAVYPGANAQLGVQHVQTAQTAIKTAALVCAQLEIPNEPIIEAFHLARQAQVSTLLMVSPWREIPDALLSLTDMLVMNEPEAVQFFHCADAPEHDVADWFTRLMQLDNKFLWQGKWLVVTLAERGCVAWVSGKIFHCSAYPIQLLDPTGAGDAFTAGLVWAWVQGHAPHDALAFANACGALVAAQCGVLPALPSLPQVQAFLNPIQP